MVPYISAGVCVCRISFALFSVAVASVGSVTCPDLLAGDMKQPYYRLHDALLILSKDEKFDDDEEELSDAASYADKYDELD